MAEHTLEELQAYNSKLRAVLRSVQEDLRTVLGEALQARAATDDDEVSEHCIAALIYGAQAWFRARHFGATMTGDPDPAADVREMRDVFKLSGTDYDQLFDPEAFESEYAALVAEGKIA